jgi:hypothetical protein
MRAWDERFGWRRRSRSGFRAGVAALLVLVGASSAVATTGDAEKHAGHDLGRVDFPVSCVAPVAPAFNLAVALLRHMTYPQARAAFERIAAIDPTCAMAHWGVAMALFQPVWPTRPRPAELRRG